MGSDTWKMELIHHGFSSLALSLASRSLTQARWISCRLYVESRERSSQNREDERKGLRRMLIKVASLLFSFPSSSSSLFVSLEAHQDLVIMSYYRW